MKKLLPFLFAGLMPFSSLADTTVTSPNGALAVNLSCDGTPSYSISLNGVSMLDNSPLGFVANIGDFSKGMTVVDCKVDTVADTYTMNRSKASVMSYKSTHLVWSLQNEQKQNLEIEFMVSDNDVAFRYNMKRHGEISLAVITKLINHGRNNRLPSSGRHYNIYLSSE